ncbi:ribosome biogenesis GTP-binding protein YihA/YsxC [Halobacteriovorax sp. HLS]|uniref:ribosome biogenesis GTP-binding protein YihA/YsxC n=1 Tax=Halobacteriovorax sp. HLS TaxID=2234000 RepID=UPI0019D4CAF4|nr:ribosome biogenesis GTP-binding protein YihA/YsxC [Halobacteriovorax sp. HLS]
MAYEIAKDTCKFRFGMSNPEQLDAWLKENPKAIGLSFVGRSNVGKSSTINSLFGKKMAKTSKTPGRTREINIFSFRLNNDGKLDESLPEFYFYDLPGYGHAQVSKEMSKNWEVLIGTFFSEISLHTLMLNIQDARHPNQKSDQEFHSFLKEFSFETFILFNKIDKLKKQKERAALNKLKPVLSKEFKWVKQMYFTSAESKDGLSQVEEAIISYLLRQESLLQSMDG